MKRQDFKQLQQSLDGADLTKLQTQQLIAALALKLPKGNPAKVKKMKGTLSEEVSSAKNTRADGNPLPPPKAPAKGGDSRIPTSSSTLGIWSGSC